MANSKNILVITQYFWPENFKINDLCLGLKERGYNITVITGIPNYPKGSFFEGYTFFNRSVEDWNGIRVIRSWLFPRGKANGKRLFLNYLSFAFSASLKVVLAKIKTDAILVFEPSPITVGIPAVIARRKYKVPIYFWVQDLWPESVSAGGGIRNKFVLTMLDRLTRFIYKRCEYILIQSEAFRAYIVAQSVASGRIVYFPNSTESFYKVRSCTPEYKRRLPDGFNIVFAGNIGEAQSFDTILDAASILMDEGISVNWNILGEGRLKEYVKNRIEEKGLKGIFFLHGSYPSTEMPYYFSCADALLVTLKKNKIFSLTIPSKVQSYLACGRPILASLDGEGARIIKEAKAGFCSEAENPKALADSIRKIRSLSGDDIRMLGVNARTYYEKEFEREKLLDKLEGIIGQDK